MKLIMFFFSIFELIISEAFSTSALKKFFLREFQFMTFTLDDSSLLSNQGTNRFLV